MALSSMSWEIGFVIGPAVGGLVLATEPLALWPLAAAALGLAVFGVLGNERRLPPGASPHARALVKGRPAGVP